ncbi:MAG: EscU/YscU/HrcU family type III secretion system export apparatus switch protein, partial [Lachnospiraceae bacterium]|nr:EscU/YscU/HrcU family type III secretion system export apparatus switch protein [Lachnospiraceae bacterium]
MDSCKRLKMNLQFFAEEGEGGEKTEEATPKKLDDARKEGQVARSHELVTAFSLIALFGSLKIFMNYLVTHFVDCFALIYNSREVYSEGVFERNFGAMYLNESLKRVLLIAFPMLAA